MTCDAAMNHLLEHDLIRAAGNELTFRHILIREVAYQTLPARRASPAPWGGRVVARGPVHWTGG